MKRQDLRDGVAHGGLRDRPVHRTVEHMGDRRVRRDEAVESDQVSEGHLMIFCRERGHLCE
jgi:hypothetical protein